MKKLFTLGLVAVTAITFFSVSTLNANHSSKVASTAPPDLNSIVVYWS